MLYGLQKKIQTLLPSLLSPPVLSPPSVLIMDDFERAIYGLSAHVEHDALASLRAADDYIYGAAKPYLQNPLVGSIAGAVPILGDYFRAHEQAEMMENYFNVYGINPTQVAYPVSSYGSMLPSVGYLAGSIGGYRRSRRSRRGIKNRRRPRSVSGYYRPRSKLHRVRRRYGRYR